MASPVLAVNYLAAAEKHPPRPVCVLFGDEPFLKRQAIARLRQEVLGGGDGEFSFAVFPGQSVLLRDVVDELATLAMFGSDKRLVLVEDADDFVTKYRGQLEDYAAKPCSGGVLVLEVRSWPANTRLAKALAADGLTIDCSALTEKNLTKWLVLWARQTHSVQLALSAADLLVEMVGPELGLLDQELSKLALVAAPGGKITPEHIGQFVGTWRAKTTWKMLDAVLDGNAQVALVELDRLLLAGEEPIAILAQISSSLRRFAAATRVILSAETAGRKTSLRDALQQAGVQQFRLEPTERQLRRLGRHRGGRLYRWLLQADLDLKGASPLPRRLILERLILRLASPVPSPSGKASGGGP